MRQEEDISGFLKDKLIFYGIVDELGIIAESHFSQNISPVSAYGFYA